MLYRIKKKIITSNIKKRQKKGYSAKEDELFELSPSDDGHINNSYFFSAHTPNGETLFIRLGLRGDGSKEVWVGYSNGSLFVEHVKELYDDSEEAALKVICITPEKEWKILFEGEMRDVKEEGRKFYRGTLEATFKASAEIFDFFYDNDPSTTAHALASEKWNKQLFSDIGANNQRHYEQAGRLQGRLTLDGKGYELDMVCGRDHSFGPRNWSYMNHHFWILGIDEEGHVLNISMVGYPCVKEIWTGYTTLYGKVDSFYKVESKTDIDSAAHGKENMKLEVTLTGGKRFEIEVVREGEAIYHFDEGAYRFSEGFGHMIVDGKKIRGTIEFSGHSEDY